MCDDVEKVFNISKRKFASAIMLAACAQALLLLPASPSAEAATTVTYTGSAAAPAHKLALWYRQPASVWESQALPIGNGAMGGMVFGGVDQEHIQLNEKTLWTGGPNSTSAYTGGNRDGAASHLASVRAKLAAGDVSGAHSEANSYLTGVQTGFGDYQSFGDMFLDFALPSAVTVSDYRRELDIEDGVARVRYTYNGVDYSREYFVSYPDKVMVMRLTASQPGLLSFDVRPTSAQGGTVTATGSDLKIRGTLAGNQMVYEANVRVLNEGGTQSPGTGKITVANANAVTVLMTLGTNYSNSYPTYVGTDPHSSEVNIINGAASKSYATLLANHMNDYKALFSRVSLNLADTKPQIPTDQLLSTYATTKDKALEVLFYQYGRYLLISSSRQGSLPANLQGVWNQSNTPPWDSDYHFNINVQMNYWPAMVTNLAEMMTPLLDYVDSLRAPGRVTAEKHFGVTGGGWSVGTMNNPFGFTAPGWAYDWGWAPSANAFIANNVWESYKFSGDTALLSSKVYPILKETTQFWTKFLVTDTDGTLVSSPCYSPEHGTIGVGCAFDQELVWDLFTHYIEASTTLGVDADYRAQVADMRSKLSPIKIGSWGQIQEWKQDIDDPNDTHRHISQLVALFPGKQINKNTPDLLQAAKVTLTHRGDGSTGWSKANKINLWARALDGTHAHTILEGQLAGSTLSNLFDTHPPFQIDGNFGATSGMSEMLLQSQSDDIEILPALPSAWPQGSYSGLLARGGFEIGAAWNYGRATRVTIKSNKGNRAVLAYPAINGAVVRDGSGAAVAYTADSGDQISFNTQAGMTYTVDAIPGLPIADSQLFQLAVKHDGLMVDVAGASTADGAAVVQTSAGSAASQMWEINSVGGSGGYYRITNKNSGKALAVAGASTSTGAKLVQTVYTADTTYNDEWRLVDKGSGYYQLINRGSGLAMDMSGSSTAPGTQIIQWTGTTAPNQQFQFIPVPDAFDSKTFTIAVKNSGLRMDVNGGSKADGAAVIQWSATTGLNQMWKFYSVGNGYYKIVSKNSGKALAVSGASTANNAGIVQATYTADAVGSDEWQVVDVGGGYYRIVNRNSGKAIDMPGAGTAAGTQFIQYSTGTGDIQKLQLVQVP